MTDPLPPETTIADLAAQGYTHLRIQCACGIKCVPFGLLHGRPNELALDELYERLRCETCHQHPKPGSLTGWRQSDAQGYVTKPRRG